MNESDNTQPSDGLDEIATDSQCFVCSPGNPITLGVRFALQEDLCVGTFTSRTEHSGFDGVTHGGIQFSLLDDVMANWIWMNGDQAFTGRCEIRYRKQMPIGTSVRIEGWQEKRRGKLAQMAGRLIDVADDSVVAEADGRFMISGRRPGY